MADTSAIEWTGATWNTTVGCTHVSPGCDLCYAARLASGRLKNRPPYDGLAEAGTFNGTVRVLPDRLELPLRWRKPRKVFVDSMSDLFHDAVPDEHVARVFAVMALTARHTFQVLTKRHARMRSLLNDPTFATEVAWQATEVIGATPGHRWSHGLDLGGQRLAGDSGLGAEWTVVKCEGPIKRVNGFFEVDAGNLWQPPWPLPNVWLGVSVEDQAWADLRIPALLATPAAVRFLSCEPLLGPIESLYLTEAGQAGICYDIDGGWWHPPGSCPSCRPRVDWIIAGGESGPGARPCDLEWLRSLRDRCADAGVPYFVKQLGTATAKRLGASGKGHDLHDLPPDLRIRQYPTEGSTAWPAR